MSLISLHPSTMLHHLNSSCLQLRTFRKFKKKKRIMSKARHVVRTKTESRRTSCDNVTVRTAFFRWHTTNHSQRGPGHRAPQRQLAATPTDSWAHSVPAVLSARADNLRELCFEMQTRCPTASPGEGRRVCAGTQCSDTDTAMLVFPYFSSLIKKNSKNSKKTCDERKLGIMALDFFFFCRNTHRTGTGWSST